MPSSIDPFERQLEAMFADPPPAPDAEAFVAALERRVTAERRRRSLVFGACTAASGLSAAAIFVLSGAFSGSGRAIAGAAGRLNGIDPSTLTQTGLVVVGLGVLWGLSELLRADRTL